MTPRRIVSFVFLVSLGAAPAAAQLQVDINRPRTPFDCDLENGLRWYGTEKRCLQELCTHENTINEWIFDDGGKRRRRNPCYRIDPFTCED